MSRWAPLAGFYTRGFKVQYITNTLEDSGFASATATDENIEIRIEVDGSTVKESADPRERHQFGVFIRSVIGVEADARVRVEKGLSQPFDTGRTRELDEGGRAFVTQIFDVGDIFRIDHR